MYPIWLTILAKRTRHWPSQAAAEKGSRPPTGQLTIAKSDAGASSNEASTTIKSGECALTRYVFVITRRHKSSQVSEYR